MTRHAGDPLGPARNFAIAGHGPAHAGALVLTAVGFVAAERDQPAALPVPFADVP